MDSEPAGKENAVVAADLLRWQIRFTWLLVLLAVLANELAMHKPGHAYDALHIVDLLLMILLIFGLRWNIWRTRHASPQMHAPLSIHLFILLLLLVPVVTMLAGRMLVHQGILLETVLAACLRNLTLALACLVPWMKFFRIAAWLSLFLLVFAMVQGESPALKYCLAGYAMIGCLWLLVHYWTMLARKTQPALTSVSTPWGALGLMSLVIGGTIVAGVVGPGQTAQALWGFLPSSGGRDDYDPFSRGGVHTGDELMRGSQDSKSTGMTDSDYFLDSPDDSLYDVTHDLYGDAIKPKDWQRAIALPVDKMLKKEMIPAESLEASKEFSLLRKPPPPTGNMENHGANALLYVQGRVPAHLRVTAYDLFDGILWSEAPHRTTVGDVELDQGTWMQIIQHDPLPVFAQNQMHVIKLAKFKSQSLPFPGHATRFRVGKLHQKNSFAWAQEGILRLADRTIPPGTVTEVESRTIDPNRLLLPVWNWDRPGHLLPYLSLPDLPQLQDRLHDLALYYTQQVPRGWQQVQAITKGLRSDFIHHHHTLPPEACRDIVGHFLDHRQGRDVDFATTAALLLRTLGYPSRVVSGFYADPACYDAKTEHTLVYKNNIHFWVEVLVQRKVWVAIEPTPGYELAGPVYSYWDATALWLSNSWIWIVQHPLLCLSCLIGCSFLVVYHHVLLDLAWRLGWNCWPGRSPRQQLKRTLDLLEWRTRGTSLERPAGLTPSRWYQQLLPVIPETAHALIPMLAWCSYAPQETPWTSPWEPHQIYATCRTLVHSCTRRQLRLMALQLHPETSHL